MKICSIFNCMNVGGHLYPKDPELRQKWLNFAGRTKIGQHAIICKAHFKESDFITLDPMKGLPVPRKRLKPNSIPTVSYKRKLIRPTGINIEPNRIVKEPLKCITPKTFFKNGNEKVYKSSDVQVKVPILSDPQLVRIIEKIKDKLLLYAPNNAIFSSHWCLHGPFTKDMDRDGPPPFSMPCLVALGIESSPENRATVHEILAFISKNFPCYKLDNSEWQSAALRTLKKYTVFKKLPAGDSPSPNHTYWTFSPDKEFELLPKIYEAFTNPRYNDSTIDSTQAITVVQNKPAVSDSWIFDESTNLTDSESEDLDSDESD